MFFKRIKNFYKSGAVQPRLNRGFTLYELLITLGVLTIIIGIVFFNQSKFKTDVEITNLAYRIALSIREAQMYSISVKQFGTDQNFNTPYGVHFNFNDSNSFILYADADNNGIYNYPGSDSGPPVETIPGEWSDMVCDTENGSECVEKVEIGRGNIIAGACGIWFGSETLQRCYRKGVPADGGEATFKIIDIRFVRPKPDAIFSAFSINAYRSDAGPDDGCFDVSGHRVSCDGWAICLMSPHEKKKEVRIYNTGQISVDDTVDGSFCTRVYD